MADEIDTFDAEPETYQFKVLEKNAQGEKALNQYELRGFDGDGMSVWMQTVARKMKGDKKGINSNTSDFRQFQASLIVLCCHDATGNRVPIGKIAGWSAKLQNYLFGKCQELNGLDDDAGDKAKKDVTPPSGGSST